MSSNNDGDQPSAKDQGATPDGGADEGDEASPTASDDPSSEQDSTEQADEGAAGSTAAAPGAHVAPRRGFIRRHKALVALVALLVILVGSLGGWLWYLNHLGDNVQRIHNVFVAEKKRPAKAETDALNILLGGSDNGADGQSIAHDVNSGHWTPGAHRSDTIMILHVTADRKHVYLVSIPRDSYVTIYDKHGDPAGKDKINAAFSLYGPTSYVSTVEHLTGLRMDHLAIIDWNGFKDLTEALHGVTVYIPKTFYDEAQKITWHKGFQTIQGKTALQYVRTRHGLANGDFDRIKRQQNFLRELMKKTLSNGTMSNPFRLTSVLKAVTSNLTVDQEFSTSQMRDLVLSLRNIHSDDVTFLTAPFAGYDTTPDGQSVVLLKTKESHALWQSIKNDDIQSYIDKYGGDTLQGADHVN